MVYELEVTVSYCQYILHHSWKEETKKKKNQFCIIHDCTLSPYLAYYAKLTWAFIKKKLSKGKTETLSVFPVTYIIQGKT